MVHDGPEEELGKGMTVDDMDNLWPWLKQKHVPVWAGVKYDRVVEGGLEITLQDSRKYLMEGKNIITTQDWQVNRDLVDQLKDLVSEVHVIGSCQSPGLIVDAIRDGAKIGRAI